MANNDNFDHTDSHGREFDDRLDAFGYTAHEGREHRRRRERRRGDRCAVEEVPAAQREHAAHEVQGHGRRPRPQRDSMLDWYWTADFGGTVTKTMPI